MKFFSFLITILFFSPYLKAQEVSVLPKDETGKYIYYEVVDVKDGSPIDSLQQRMLGFIAQAKKEIKLKTIEGASVMAKGKIVINKSLAMLSHPSGEITYSFQFETNTNKYRFWFSDFEFIPYQKDRYGNFVPSTTVGIPLEKEVKKMGAAQWEDYKQQTLKYALDFAKRLKDYLDNKVKKTPTPTEKKVISKTW